MLTGFSKCDGQKDLNENGEGIIYIPEDLLIQKRDSPLLSLVHFVYPQNVLNMIGETLFDDGAIICPTTIEVVEEVNDFILSLIDGEEKMYLSLYTPCQCDEDNDIQSEWFTSEFLNDIKCSRIPTHKIKLKVSVPIMLLRNIDQANGLCNGTRFQVNHLSKNVIFDTVIVRKNIGEKIFIQHW